MFLSGRKEMPQKTFAAMPVRTAAVVIAVRIRGLVRVLLVMLRRWLRGLYRNILVWPSF
jgi:hypothetical protein